MKKCIGLLLTVTILLCTTGLVITGCSTQKTKDENNNTTEDTKTVTKESDDKKETKKQTQEKKETVNIIYSNFSGTAQNMHLMGYMRDKFNEMYESIHVETEGLGWSEYWSIIATRAASGNLPDVFELNYENFVTYAMNGELLNITPLIADRNIDLSVMNKTALEAFEYEGSRYGLPEVFNSVVMFYNKDLFDQAGIDYPSADWTWEDQQEAAEKIRTLGENTFGIMQPVNANEFYKMCIQNGGGIISEDKKRFTINTAENIEALEYMVDRVIKSNVMATTAQMSGMDEWAFFTGGYVGMYPTGTWAFNHFAENCDFEWDISIEPGNIKKATHFYSDAVVMPKDAENVNEGLEWMLFLACDPESVKIRLDNSWGIPAITDQDVLADFLAAKPPENRQVVFDSLEYGIVPPKVKGWTEVYSKLGTYLEAARDGKMTPKEALDAAQEEFGQIPVN